MKRLKNVRSHFDRKKIDGLLVTSNHNRRYLTNFTGTAGVVLFTQEKACFITDFRYTEQAKSEAVGYEIVQYSGSLLDEIKEQIKRFGIKRLGFEQDYVSFSQWSEYRESFECELIPVSNVIESQRKVKDDKELSIIKKAADIADAAFKHILDVIKPGVAELEVANELEYFMRRSGAISSSFDIIVASGVRSALPHGVASEKIIETGDFVTMDYGALYKGYVSDITRTIAVGEPSEQLKEIYEVVLTAQMNAVEKIKPGMTGKEADAIARDYIEEKGFGKYFGHSLGHGIGLEVHEGPTLSMRSNETLQPGMVVTVEPGIYLPNVGGVRIEDDIVITETGNELLTHSTKNLIIL